MNSSFGGWHLKEHDCLKLIILRSYALTHSTTLIGYIVTKGCLDLPDILCEGYDLVPAVRSLYKEDASRVSESRIFHEKALNEFISLKKLVIGINQVNFHLYVQIVILLASKPFS